MPNHLSRRDALAFAGVAALGASAATSCTPREHLNENAQAARFPPDFQWGVATSSYQIEGAVNEDGRGRSIWDTYAHTPGKIEHGDTGDVANDHYRRYREDVALMRSMGVKAYRFSIAWPRIFPEGVGRPNQRGVDFYSRLVDALREAGIEPFPTLYHWDLPQALQDRGGWQSRDTAEALADYAAYITRQLGDRVTNWFTLNEMHTFVDMGHQGISTNVQGRTVRIELAPGLQLPNKALAQVRHHAVLAQGLAAQAIHAARSGLKCGPADNISVFTPLLDTPENVRAAEAATRAQNAGYLTVILEGKYLDSYLGTPDAPQVTEADMRAIAAPVDFVGINLYRPSGYVVASDAASGYTDVPFNTSHPKMQSSWHLLDPAVMYWGPRIVQSLWNPAEIYITENGCAGADVIAADGHVYDTDRIMFTRLSLADLQRATAAGVPVKGYFHWSLMDNFEWSAGYGNRFGLVHVDFDTQERRQKTSAGYFKACAKQNAVA